MMRAWVVFGLLGLAGVAGADLTEAERAGIDEALYFDNLRPSDLNFDRLLFRNLDLMPVVVQGLQEPLAAADALRQWHASGLDGRGAVALGSAVRRGWPSVALGTAPEGSGAGVVEGLPPKTGAIVARLMAVMVWSDGQIREATSRLSPDEARLLIESLPVTAVDEPKVTFAFVRNPTVGIGRVAQLMGRVDLGKILAAGQVVASATETAAAALRQTGETVEGKVRVNVEGRPVVVAGVGDDLHDETDVRLTIDLGGDDVYRGRHGAGVGYTGVMIDLGGDDRVKVPDLSVGAGVLGVGVAYFHAGDDRFEGSSLNFGSGLGGVGFFYKEWGHDLYQSVSLSQGFGMYGVGLLMDTAGNDEYRTGLFGQGAGRTEGVGWLVDKVGRDTYRAGGLSLNSPLFATAHYAFAQGFGMGFREDTGGVGGGVGLLSDGQGDDIYWGETYAQAASYWFSVGSLLDLTGNDVYFAHHYGQGSAMHATSAYLFDLAGDDSYSLRVGAGQGTGHDFGVGFLLDRAGDDLYASRDARPGSGLANGLGIFLDSAGADKYTTAVGYGRFDRSFGSLGLFVDLSGADLYGVPTAGVGFGDGTGQGRGGFSVAFDLGEPGVGAAAPSGSGVRPGSKPIGDDAAMEALYAKATQWGVGTAEQEVAAALDELVAMGVPALEWMLDKKLANANRLHIRAFAHVVRALEADAAAPVGRKALAATDAETDAILRIAMQTNLQDVGALIPGILANKPDLRLRATQAAGVLRARGAVNALMPLTLLADDPMLAREAMVALELIGAEEALGTAISLIEAEDFLVRRSAVRLIAKFPEQALATARTKLGSNREFSARMGVEVLRAMTDSTEAMNLLVNLLLDPRPGVRISALNALAGRVPEGSVETVRSLTQDPIPAVRMAARGALLR